MGRIKSKNARSLTGYLIDSAVPLDGQALVFDLASKTYIPVTVASHNLVSGSGTTYAVDRYNLGGPLTADADISGGASSFDLNIGTAADPLKEANVYAISGLHKYQSGAGYSQKLNSSVLQQNSVTDGIGSGTTQTTQVGKHNTTVQIPSSTSYIEQTPTVIQLAIGSLATGNGLYVTAGLIQLNETLGGAAIELSPTRAIFQSAPGLGATIALQGVNNVFIDKNTVKSGFQYSADYSANYTDRSMVDKAFVVSLISSSKAYQGGYNPVTNTPDLTTPIAGIESGDVWDIVADGTFYGEVVEIGDTITSRAINPSSLADWVIGQTNLTAASVKVMYESNANTNAYTDAEQTKLGGIEAGATADQTDNEIVTAFNNIVAVVTQVEAEAISSGATRQWTPFRVGQAVKANRVELTKSLYLQNPLATDDIGIWEPGIAITITKVVYKVTGATSVAFNINNGTDLWATDKVATTTRQVSSTFTTAAMAADAYIRYQASALVGTPTAIEMTITYTED